MLIYTPEDIERQQAARAAMQKWSRDQEQVIRQSFEAMAACFAPVIEEINRVLTENGPLIKLIVERYQQSAQPSRLKASGTPRKLNVKQAFKRPFKPALVKTKG